MTDKRCWAWHLHGRWGSDPGPHACPASDFPADLLSSSCPVWKCEFGESKVSMVMLPLCSQAVGLRTPHGSTTLWECSGRLTWARKTRAERGHHHLHAEILERMKMRRQQRSSSSASWPGTKSCQLLHMPATRASSLRWTVPSNGWDKNT